MADDKKRKKKIAPKKTSSARKRTASKKATRPKTTRVKKPSETPFLARFQKLEKKYRDLPKNETDLRESLRSQLYDFLEKHFHTNDIISSRQAIKKSSCKKEDIDAAVKFFDFENEEKDQTIFYERGMPVLEALANTGHAHAMSLLSYIMLYSSDVPLKYRRRAKARLILEKVTKCNEPKYVGYAHAQLAELYYVGTGSELDQSAIRHAEYSANDLGSPYGQSLLSRWYFEGTAVEKNEKKGFQLIEKAFQNVTNMDGYHRSLVLDIHFHYGWAKYYGIGCEEDKAFGREAILDCAEKGYQDAIDWLKDMEHRTDTPSASEKTDSVASGKNPFEPFAGRGKHARLTKAAEKIKNKKELKKLLDPLHSMIGCDPVKREIESLIFLAYTNALRLKKNMDTAPVSLHAAFLGAPGTGKTTVARMYSHLLHELGYLTKGHVVEVSRADLVGEYIGQTAPLVRSKVEEAIGGVLFVDEAYSLIPDDPYRDFGPEALAELIQQMENRRENLVVVFAGYTDEMKLFLKTNPGLKSRVPNLIVFPDYSADEMVRIFEKMCRENHYTPTADALAHLLRHLKKQDKESVRRMGNARGVRNIFEESIVHQARRLFHSGKTSKKALMAIEAEDIVFPDGGPQKHLRLVKDTK